MFGWLAKWLGRRPPLRGGPAQPRLKTYAAQSGYVYQYFFLGRQEGRYQGEPATEYVFQASAGAERRLAVQVVVPESSLAPVETAWGRKLAGNERYAVAKMALFQAFDERPEPASMRAGVIVRASDAAAILARLGFL
jgi:hypothetical protein